MPGLTARAGFATRAVHAGAGPDPATGARAVPVYQSNGFVFESLQHGADLFALKRSGFAYSRGLNPTTAALERRIADLEGGTAAIACASGQAAWLMVLLTLCASGDHIVATRNQFGGSLALFRRLQQRLGIGLTLVDPEPAAVAAAIRPNTRVIAAESVVNPTGEVIDLPGLAAAAGAAGVPLAVDNTLATPALLRPVEHGADIVIHSASKFLVGHGQAIGGLIVDAGRFPYADGRFPLIGEPWPDYEDIILAEAFPASGFATACRMVGLRELGPGMSPMTAFFILTGIETLPLRMARHCANAAAVAGFLARHPKVEAVSHPAVREESRRAAERLMPGGSGAVFVATLRGGRKAAEAVLSRSRLFSHLVNIGEVRSLVAHPETTTHRTMSPEDRVRLGIGPGTLRLSVGIEDVEDLIADLDQALTAA